MTAAAKLHLRLAERPAAACSPGSAKRALHVTRDPDAVTCTTCRRLGLGPLWPRRPRLA